MEDAKKLMEDDARRDLELEGRRLMFDYAYGGRHGGGGGAGGAGEGGGEGGEAPADWVCEMCQAVNFAR